MAKRFTDSKKWRNEWFRTLHIEARLLWIYLCDECELTGVMKMDYGLASFLMGFEVTREIVGSWFKNKIHFIDTEKFLIIQFFEFQYGESKDSWSAKIQAKNKLESLGFSIVNNKVLIDSIHHYDTTVGGLSGECGPTLLIKGIVKGKGKVEVNKGGVGENSNTPQDPFFQKRFNPRDLPEAALIWNEHRGDLTEVKMTSKSWNIRSNALIADYGVDIFTQALVSIKGNSFLTGQNKRKWKVTFAWFIQENNFAKVLNGDYSSQNSVDEMLLDLDKALEAL